MGFRLCWLTFDGDLRYEDGVECQGFGRILHLMEGSGAKSVASTQLSTTITFMSGVLNHLVRWGFCWKNSSLRDFLYILKSISAPIGAWEWWLTDWPTNQRTDGPTDRRTKRVIGKLMIQNWCVENCSCDDFSLIEYVLSGLRSAMRKLVLAGDISDTFNITSS